MIIGPRICVPTFLDVFPDPEPGSFVPLPTELNVYYKADGQTEHRNMLDTLMLRYRRRMICDCDIDRWKQRLFDRAYMIAEEAGQRLQIYMDSKASFSSLEAGSAEYSDVTEHEEMPFSTVAPAGKQYLKTRDTHTVRSKSYQDLNTSTAKQAMEDVPSFEKWYVSQFEDLFLGRWR